MSAPLNNYLFGEHFKRIHKMSVEDALSGKIAKINDSLMSPEEYDNAWSGSRIGAGMRPFSETHSELIKPTDVSATVRQFQMERGEHLVGNTYRVAASLRDLTDAVRGNSRENDLMLYRGARRSPSADIGETRDNALSFTPDLNVARSFAAPRGNSRGSIFKAAPGLVRGVPLSEIGGIRRTVGDKRRPEAEWLVDPASVPTEWPKR